MYHYQTFSLDYCRFYADPLWLSSRKLYVPLRFLEEHWDACDEYRQAL
jgi:hypothetical protein